MSFRYSRAHVTVLLLAIAASASARAATPVFSEEFVNAANWLTGDFSALTEVPSGGPGGSSYVSLDAAFKDIGQGTIFRGHAAFGASDGAFTGNWIEEEYLELSTFVRHNAPIPLSYFVRIAAPANFPAAGVASFVPVLPNTWTQVTFRTFRGSPQIVTLEGSTYDAIFSNVGNIQLAVSVPDNLQDSATEYTFDLDNVTVSIVPEPSALCLLAAGMLAITGNCRNRKARGRNGNGS